MNRLPAQFPVEAYAPRLPPYAHQLEALKRGWGKEGFAYLMEMGLAKSRVLIDEVCALYKHDACDAMLLLASKGVYTNWTRESDEDPGELQKWLWDEVREDVFIYTWRNARSKTESGRRAGLTSPSPGLRVLAVNVEALSLMTDAYDLCVEFCRSHRTLVVVDESTLIKNPRSSRTKAVMQLRRLAAWRRILTGSPITGRATDLYSQFEFLAPRALGFSNFVAYRARYCTLRELQVNGRAVVTVTGAQNTDELHTRVMRHSYRALKKDCLDLPDKIYVRREIDLTPEQAVAYKEMKRNAEVRLSETDASTTQVVVTQIMRLHQIACGHLKLDDGRVLRYPENRVAELMEVVGETDSQAIVWCTYQSDVVAVRTALETEYGRGCCAEWHGGVQMADRELGEAEFKAGRRRFMLATPQAAARGRTWTCATLVVYYSNNHDLELREQSEDRAHRIGQTEAVTYVDIVARGTVDASIVQSLRNKKSVVEAVLRDGPAAWI